jgi:glycosyltransferase involved in cell wall biosynthesis
LTIVTNKFLADIVEKFGGRPLVLPDKLPEICRTQKVKLKGQKQILMISSFGDDEPIKEVISAMKAFAGENLYLYISGNYHKIDDSVIKNAPENIIFTGFLEDQDFVNILFSADAVMVLTTSDYCMLCGCYEAFAAMKPLITSDKSVLKEYFNGAVFVDDTPGGIAAGIYEVLHNIDKYTALMHHRKKIIEAGWNRMYAEAEKEFSKLTNRSNA